MIVWTDVFSGDEMVSDSYKYSLIHNDACLEVAAKYITKGSDFVAIAGKYFRNEKLNEKLNEILNFS